MKNPSDNKPAKVYDSLADNYESWIEESAGLKIIYRAFHEAINNNRERLKGCVLCNESGRVHITAPRTGWERRRRGRKRLWRGRDETNNQRRLQNLL